MSARDEAAVRHAESVLYPNRKVLRPVDEYTLQRLRELSADDFKVGWNAGRDAALSEQHCPFKEDAENLQRRIDAALAHLKTARMLSSHELKDEAVKAAIAAITTEEQERE